jgi:hypothetical protein
MSPRRFLPQIEHIERLISLSALAQTFPAVSVVVSLDEPVPGDPDDGTLPEPEPGPLPPLPSDNGPLWPPYSGPLPIPGPSGPVGPG